ncbi:MAG: protoheme IX farnesyltransferase [Chloroflexi bacterium]|nr:protoheme IX farnesyltransferase [Chloroflexota bacterium]
MSSYPTKLHDAPPTGALKWGGALASTSWRDMRELGRTLAVLFKLRIVTLLLFSAAAGLFLGAGRWPGPGPLLLLLVTGGVTAAGASALNEYLEREADARMRRTRQRPLVAGTLSRTAWVPVLGMAMISIPALAVLPGNPALAFFLAAGAIVYLGVYTIWLKPRTVLNIVIGGAAGSCAVLSGGAVVGAWTDPGVLGLAAVVFFWTPIHFWSLALVYREDYARAGVPMLPVRTTSRRAAFWGAVHGLVAGMIGVMLARHPALGPLYLAFTSAVTLYLLAQGVRLVVHPSRRRAWRLFHASNFYLAVVLFAISLDTLMRWP